MQFWFSIVNVAAIVGMTGFGVWLLASGHSDNRDDVYDARHSPDVTDALIACIKKEAIRPLFLCFEQHSFHI